MINKLVVFTGPSAVGKATIEHELFNDKELKLCLSVSATTRKPREGEKDGVHYYFISHEEFNEKIKNNEFIEWNEHFSNKYGTLKSEVERISNEGNVPFLEVEPVGAKNVIENYGDENVISIFIKAPSLNDLRNRMIERGTETLEQIEQRLSRVKEELGYVDIFQNVVVNDDINVCVQKVKNIIRGNK